MSRTPEPLTKDAVATVALCGYTMAVAMGFARVFGGWAFMSDFALIAIVGHGVSFALRRARVSGWIAIPGLAIVLMWLLTVIYYRQWLNWLLPGSDVWHEVETQLALVRDRFPTQTAPVLYEDISWASLSGFALVLVIVMSDSFAFRAEARGEALVPGGVLFVFIAALGDDRLRIASTVVLVAAGVLAVIALRQLHDRRRATVLAPRRGLGSPTVLAALASALAIALVAGIVGPRIPGARAEPLYDTKGRGGTNLIANPLVDIRSRLTNRGNVRLFRVSASEPAYWRLITLSAFDGEQFTLPPTGVSDVASVTTSGDGTRIRQRIQIQALEGDTVPAAADFVQASGTSNGERFSLTQDRDSNTLVSPQEFEAGDTFDVVSIAPPATPDRLRGAGVGGVPDPIYLELPDNLPDVLYDETERLTAGAATPYDAALAIQSWFRDPDEFSYSLDVSSGHDGNAIESFLQVRAGYCEQFAATFAAMARAAGIPSRVAVGYTPGTQDEEPGWYSVIGKNSHAWPELWFDGVGWVAFEPTPGRGAPGEGSYLPGVTFEQDESGPTAEGTGAEAPSGGTEPTVPPTVAGGATGATTTTIAESGGAEGDGGLAAPLRPDDQIASGDPSATDGGRSALPWIVMSLLVALAAALAGPWFVRRVRRRRRRARGPVEQVAAAWDRACSAAVDAGVPGTPAMTGSEWATATAKVLPIAARPMGDLAGVVDLVIYARPDEVDLRRRGSYGESLGDDCDLWASQIQRFTTDNLPATKRVQRYFTDLR